MIRAQGERSLQGWEERGDSGLSVVLWRISLYASGLQKKKEKRCWYDEEKCQKQQKNLN